KLKLARRGASTDSCKLMPKTVRFRNTCSIAWLCTSPPGVPKGIASPLGPMAMAGLGVSRGRLPGAAAEGCFGSPQDCEPRDDGTRPVPGTIGEEFDTSLGVAENTLPQRSV